MGLLIGLAVAGAITGVVASVANANAKQKQMTAEYNDKVTSLERQTESLLSQKNEMAQKVENLGASTKRADATLDTQIGSSQTNQQSSLTQSAGSMQQQDALSNQQIATMQVQARQAEGTANQQVATSGFRNTGTADNVLQNQKQSDTDSIDQAKAQATLSRYNNYNNARNTYVSYDQQIASYKQQQQDNIADYNDQIKVYKYETERMEADYNNSKSDLEYLKGEGKDALNEAIATTWVSEIFGGLSNGLGTVSNAYGSYLGSGKKDTTKTDKK